ncbi:cytochrome P450 [Calocera cornea HHB12733]|uniref:Cytochrome P450 n=1 Tax=Calocera cornea HHB12733 TaxID=1353952 RepID=A0A165CTC7_9BASI|nr:cytochrome P450 [Calocera cornea HHB12733]
MSKVPGPWLAKFTDAWFFYHLFAGDVGPTLRQLHHLYGPLVRTGPNTVTAVSLQDQDLVIKSHKYLKDTTGNEITNLMGIPNVFSTIDPDVHMRLRRMTNPTFIPSVMKKTEVDIREGLSAVYERINLEANNSKPINVLSFYRMVTLDVLGIACFGKTFGCMETGKPHPYLEDMDAWLVQVALRAALPPVLYHLVGKLPIPSIRFIYEADARICSYSNDLIAKHRAERDQEHDPTDMIGHMRLSIDPVTRESMSDRLITGNLGIYLFAGTDTTAIALMFITWELARGDDIYSKLRKELEAAMPDADSLLTYQELTELPYLSAVIREGLRRYAPAVAIFNRVIPEEGAWHDGMFLPGGTKIGIPSPVMHYNESIFPNPMTFQPERWLKKGADVALMNEQSMPFGGGVRMCQGRPLAEMELWLVVAMIVRRYKLKSAASTTAESMEDISKLSRMPKSGRCDIIFEEYI